MAYKEMGNYGPFKGKNQPKLSLKKDLTADLQDKDLKEDEESQEKDVWTRRSNKETENRETIKKFWDWKYNWNEIFTNGIQRQIWVHIRKKQQTGI